MLEMEFRLEENISQMIKMKNRIAITEIWLPMDEMMFHVT
jgi:hypothetical protein